MSLIAPIPAAPFSVLLNGKSCFQGLPTETEAAVTARRMVIRGARLAEVVDADGWKCNIYVRADA